VFWIWVCGILGMVTKYAEAALAVRYREKTREGYSGGPMYIITHALPRKMHFLAWFYGLFGLIAAFGVGNATQINAAITGIREACRAYQLELTPLAQLLITSVLAVLLGVLLLGGAKAIGKAAEGLVPFAAAGYILLCLGVLVMRRNQLAQGFSMIFRGAFSPKAVTGGMIGSAFQTLRIGCSRGVFTNEAGMGTAAIAHAEAEGVHPARQGMMGLMEVFLDTLVLCTLTALVILVSGVPVPYGVDAGGELTVSAFSQVYGGAAAAVLAAALTLFAVATVLGWGLYGARCAEFLFGSRVWPYFAAAQVVTVFAGSFLETGLLWQLAEAVNGLMAIPNLIMLALLAPEAARLTKEYRKSGPSEAGGGTYADFH
jgi:AGCS family alanine or glycine:cation symporter